MGDNRPSSVRPALECALRIVSRDTILRFKNTVIIIIIMGIVSTAMLGKRLREEMERTWASPNALILS